VGRSLLNIGNANTHLIDALMRCSFDELRIAELSGFSFAASACNFPLAAQNAAVLIEID